MASSLSRKLIAEPCLRRCHLRADSRPSQSSPGWKWSSRPQILQHHHYQLESPSSQLHRALLSRGFLRNLFRSSHVAVQIDSSPCWRKPFLASPNITVVASGGVLDVFPKPIKRFSSTPTGSDPPKEAQDPAVVHEFRHQEIIGPTVERDVSAQTALASEICQVLERMRKCIYDLSVALALLGMTELGLGAWITYAYAGQPPTEVLFQGPFAFMFSMAFLLWRRVTAFFFLHKMEEQGRLLILTLTLQVSK